MGDDKIYYVTVDNASSNSVAISYLSRGMCVWNGKTLLKGGHMHLHCCAHVLNLIVSEWLKHIDVSIAKIRTVWYGKFVKSSPSKLASFKRCAQDLNVKNKARLILDVPIRWNSTYLMLDVAEKYE